MPLPSHRAPTTTRIRDITLEQLVRRLRDGFPLVWSEDTDEELRRFDRQRKDKKGSNDEWTSTSPPWSTSCPSPAADMPRYAALIAVPVLAAGAYLLAYASNAPARKVVSECLERERRIEELTRRR